MNQLVEKYNALPRIGKWGVWAALVIVLFFGLFEPIDSYQKSIASREETIETALKEQHDHFETEGAKAQELAALQSAFGSPLMPSPGGLKPEAFSRVVNSILESHNITDRTVSERRVRLNGDLGATLAVGNIDRLILEVTFDAQPETVIAVLADLERSPEVAAVSRVRFDKAGVRAGTANAEEDHLVRATITPEAWVVAGSSSSGPSGGEATP